MFIPQTSQPATREDGFTLVEILTGLVVMAAVSAALLIVYPNIANNAECNKAITRAKLIDSARRLYAVNAADSTDWDAQDTSGRLGLLTTQGYLSGSVSEYTTYSFGYSIQLSGQIRDATLVLKDGLALTSSP